MPGLTVLMITFSNQIRYLSGQTKFGRTNLLYIINENFIELMNTFHKHWAKVSSQASLCLDCEIMPNFTAVINTIVIGFGKTDHNVTFDISRNTDLKY